MTVRILASEVIHQVSLAYSLTARDMHGDRRSRDVTRPRQLAMYLVRRLCPHMSYPQIGRMLGGRDHTTILHGVKNIEKLIQIDGDFAREARWLEKRVRGVLGVSYEPPPPADLLGAFDAMCREYARAMQAAA